MAIDHLPNGRPVLLDHNGRPMSRDDAELGKARSGGLVLPGGWVFAADVKAGNNAFWIDRFDSAMRFGRTDAVDMRNDARMMALINERKFATFGLKWHLEVPDDKDEHQARVKDGCARMIKSIPFLHRIVWAALDAIWYGRQGVQLEWKWIKLDDRPSKPSQGEGPPGASPQGPPGGPQQFRMMGNDWRGAQTGPGLRTASRQRKGLTVRSAWPVQGDKIGHLMDGTPYVLVNPSHEDEIPNGVFTGTSVGGRGLVLHNREWQQRFLIHRHEQDDRDFFLGIDQAEAMFGVGVRHYVFWSQWLKLEALSQVVNFFSRVGLGMTIWKYPSGNSEALLAVQKAAREQNDRANVFIPVFQEDKSTGNAVERVEVPTSGAEAVMKLVEYYDEQIQRYIVGQEGSSSATSAAGHSNHESSSFMKETKASITRFDALNLQCTLSGTDDEAGLVNTIQRYTYPDTLDDFPVKWVFDLEETESQEKLQALKTVVDMGVKVRADDARSAAGVGKPADGDEIIQPPQEQGAGGPGGAMGGAPGAPGGAAPPPGDFLASLGLPHPGAEGAGAGGGEAPEGPAQHARSYCMNSYSRRLAEVVKALKAQGKDGLAKRVVLQFMKVSKDYPGAISKKDRRGRTYYVDHENEQGGSQSGAGTPEGQKTAPHSPAANPASARGSGRESESDRSPVPGQARPLAPYLRDVPDGPELESGEVTPLSRGDGTNDQGSSDRFLVRTAKGKFYVKHLKSSHNVTGEPIDVRESARNEVLVPALAQAYGIDAPPARAVTFRGKLSIVAPHLDGKALIVAPGGVAMGLRDVPDDEIAGQVLFAAIADVGDRHEGNYYLADGRLHSIDHESAFKAKGEDVSAGVVPSNLALHLEENGLNAWVGSHVRVSQEAAHQASVGARRMAAILNAAGLSDDALAVVERAKVLDKALAGGTPTLHNLAHSLQATADAIARDVPTNPLSPSPELRR